MRIGLALEEIFNPRMKRAGAMNRLFKTLNNTYIQKIFEEMDEAEREEAREAAKEKEGVSV